VESYSWVAKQVFWGAGSELPGCDALFGGFWIGLTIGCDGYTIYFKTREGRVRLTTTHYDLIREIANHMQFVIGATVHGMTASIDINTDMDT
jgi:hypothetical protein